MSQILVIKTSLLQELGYFHGFLGDNPERYLAAFDEPNATQFMTRELAEKSPAYKQLIPYAVFNYKRRDGVTEVFSYQRNTAGGENRLHGDYSIGVGGHVERHDKGNNKIIEAFFRETTEELHYTISLKHPKVVGLINDDSDEVGQVHLGVVLRYDLEHGETVAPKDESFSHGKMRTVPELWRLYLKMENWSRLAMRAMFPAHEYLAPSDYRGMDIGTAETVANIAGLASRISKQDGEAQFTDMRLQPDRLNFEVSEGTVSDVETY